MHTCNHCTRPAHAQIVGSIGTTAHGVLLSENASAAVATGAGTAGQLLRSGGGSADGAYFTFPTTKYSPSANCVNAVSGSAWSTGATPAALCRAGTNNKGGLLSPWGASDVAYVQFHIDADADLTTVLPNLMLELTSTDATNGHRSSCRNRYRALRKMLPRLTMLLSMPLGPLSRSL